MQGDAPASVNPSLWRQAKLNGMHGLYQVREGIYQVRGYDVSNMTWIRGRSGWIVVDPLLSRETARAADRRDAGALEAGEHGRDALAFLREVRDARGLAYSAYASIQPGPTTGLFLAGCWVKLRNGSRPEEL